MGREFAMKIKREVMGREFAMKIKERNGASVRHENKKKKKKRKGKQWGESMPW